MGVEGSGFGVWRGLGVERAQKVLEGVSEILQGIAWGFFRVLGF